MKCVCMGGGVMVLIGRNVQYLGEGHRAIFLMYVLVFRALQRLFTTPAQPHTTDIAQSWLLINPSKHPTYINSVTMSFKKPFESKPLKFCLFVCLSHSPSWHLICVTLGPLWMALRHPYLALTPYLLALRPQWLAASLLQLPTDPCY